MKIPVRCRFRQKHCKHEFVVGTYTKEKNGRREYLEFKIVEESKRTGFNEIAVCRKCGMVRGFVPLFHTNCRHTFYPYFEIPPHCDERTKNLFGEWTPFFPSDQVIKEGEQ